MTGLCGAAGFAFPLVAAEVFGAAGRFGTGALGREGTSFFRGAAGTGGLGLVGSFFTCIETRPVLGDTDMLSSSPLS